MNLTPLNSNNRPFFTTKSFRRPTTTQNQQLSNSDQYCKGYSKNLVTSSKTCQDAEVRNNIEYGNYESAGDSGYAEGSEQYSSFPNGRYSLNYASNPNQTVSATGRNNTSYSTFGQFRQFYANLQDKNEQTQDPVEAKPSLFLGKDTTYPDQLNILMNPFFCALCSARLNSIKSANIHYESKAHDKHITSWLKKTYIDKGLDSPNLQRFATELNIEPPGVYRCELCQLELSSAQHALQHYNGRRHRQMASKTSPPTGIGYFNVEGKWVQTGKVLDKVTGKETSYVLVQTPSGFEPVVLHVSPSPSNGPKRLADIETSKNKEPPAKRSHIVANDAKTAEKNKVDHFNPNADTSKVQHQLISVNAATDNDPTTNSNQYKALPMHSQESQQTTQTPEEALESRHCKVCGIATTSPDQMLLHLKGQRHSKKLKALGEQPYSMKFLDSSATILECLNTSDPHDISIYRTPSGSYYCKMCNVAVEGVSQMKAHISSKKHLAAAKNEAANVKKGQ